MAFKNLREPIRVLVVEDNQVVNTAWLKVIEQEVNAGQFEATQVDNLNKALKLLDRESFDVILLDLILPDNEGISTFSQVFSRAPELPVVVTSFQDDRGVALEVLREGAQDYLVKGEVDADRLKRAMLYAIERHRTRVMLQQLSFSDDLTGLLNRRGFLSLAQQQLKIALREHWELLLLFADLDSLKVINDTFGHPEGDQALRMVATILKETFRTSDLIARLGGDEFIVLAINAPAAGIQAMMARLHANIDRYNMQNRYFQLALSFGTAMFDPAHPIALEEMILRADKALYKQKRSKHLA